MADNMAEEDAKQLYDLHFKYFSTHPRFKTVMKKREREQKPFTLDRFKMMFKGKLIFRYDSMNDQNYNMMKIYEYFECKNMSDLLHIYTLEDGMLLALIMSNIFERMYGALGLDPTNFASTAKYSYVSCKRIMNMTMQTIPNGRVFNAVVEMKRAGFSMIKKQVSLAF